MIIHPDLWDNGEYHGDDNLILYHGETTWSFYQDICGHNIGIRCSRWYQPFRIRLGIQWCFRKTMCGDIMMIYLP